jgi:hypothetical protein
MRFSGASNAPAAPTSSASTSSAATNAALVMLVNEDLAATRKKQADRGAGASACQRKWGRHPVCHVRCAAMIFI